MKKIFVLFSIALLASSCVKQMEEPESAKIAGMWAVVDDNDLTARYVEFEQGYVTEYVSDPVTYYVVDKTVWGCPETGFKHLSNNRYSLIDGTLHYGSNHQKILIDGETMTLGDKKYCLVENFCPEYYSTINVSNFAQSFAFNGCGVEWSYNITQPVEGFTLKVKAPDWISGLKVTAEKISFTVPETTTTRTGIITLSYPSAEDLKISVTQRAAEINLDKFSVTLGYAASSSSFTYSIPDQQAGYTLKVEASHVWITNVRDNGRSISFSVKENNSGSTRTGKITVTYAGVSKGFTVKQEKGPVNLSLSGTANCYVISETGTYFFKPVKGNSSTSVGTVSSVAVLWESFGTNTTPSVGDLVESVSYKDGNIYFDTATTFKEGNAVIAAKDASGTILWSWHIWFTDQPQGQVYYNNAGTMMDRNLGATSATPGDIGALGLLYQWGRKDPFLGSSSISRRTLAKSTISWPSTVGSDSSTGTISYATAHPTTFITYNSGNWDWYYTGSSSTDDTRWTTSDKTKSIYDPCPAGWRVPDGGDNGVWSKAKGSSSRFDHTYNSSNEGVNFSGKFGSASTIWYPASGYFSYFFGSLYDVGNDGYYWSASPYSNDAYCLSFDSLDNVDPSDDGYRADGRSVRCLQE